MMPSDLPLPGELDMVDLARAAGAAIVEPAGSAGLTWQNTPPTPRETRRSGRMREAMNAGRYVPLDALAYALPLNFYFEVDSREAGLSKGGGGALRESDADQYSSAVRKRGGQVDAHRRFRET